MPKYPKPDGVVSVPRTKGKKVKRRLKDVSRELPNEAEHEALRDLMFNGPPLAAAILGQALVEVELDNLLRNRLNKRDMKTWEKLTDDGGPLGTFSQKIDLAHALGLATATISDHLHRIRRIRNCFAHSKKLVDFDDEAVRDELRHINQDPRQPKQARNLTAGIASEGFKTPRTSFHALCTLVHTALVQRDLRRLRTASRNRDAALLRRSNAFYGTFTSSGRPTNYLAAILKNRTGDPSRQGLGAVEISESPLVLRASSPESNDNEDK